MTEFFKRQFEYNFQINQVFIDSFRKKMPPSEALRLLSHVVNAHFIWLQRMGLETEAPDVWEIHLPETLDVFNRELHQLTNQLLDQEGWQDRVINYKNTRGEAYMNTAKDILFHLVNHSTHHRAQISFLLRRMEIEPPKTDFIFWAR